MKMVQDVPKMVHKSMLELLKLKLIQKIIVLCRLSRPARSPFVLKHTTSI